MLSPASKSFTVLPQHGFEPETITLNSDSQLLATEIFSGVNLLWHANLHW